MKLGLFVVTGVAALLVGATNIAAATYATEWVQGHNSRTRLIVGGAPDAYGKIQRYAALEVALEPGWKTYWRQPGSAGGIPPSINWQGSVNLKTADLKYPAPIRMTDPSGDTIGYKTSVVFPIALEPIRAGQPLVLNLNAYFGVCREICIPAQAKFKVTLNEDLFHRTPPELLSALSKLPVQAGRANGAPQLQTVKSETLGPGRHALTFEVAFPAAGAPGADLFAETGDNQALGMSKTVARQNDTIKYRVIVRDAHLWKSINASGIVLTIVSEAGASEARVPKTLQWPAPD